MPSQTKPPLIQYWHEPEPPDYIAELIATFAAMNPDMEHMVFDEASAEEFIAEHYGEREVDAFRACGLPAMQADYFRYFAVHTLGGVYVDVDHRCVERLPDLVGGGTKVRLFRAGPVVFNAMLAVESPFHPFFEAVQRFSTTLIERRFSAPVAYVTGPALLTTLFWMHRVPRTEALLRYVERGIEPTEAELDDRFYRSLLLTLECSSQEADLLRIAKVTVGEDLLQRAFDGVAVSSMFSTPESPLRKPDAILAYKKSPLHWRNAGSRIYREAGDGIA